MPAFRLAVLPALVVLATSAACGSSSGGGSGPGAGSGSTTTVTASDTACEVGSSTLPAGKNVLTVNNTGSDATEVYVYGKGSSGAYDKVLGEVENVGPGISRKLTVTLAGTEVEVACKPGQKGDGIRTKVALTGGSNATQPAAAYDREVAVIATNFGFAGTISTAKVGEKVEFKLKNNGQTTHEFEVLDASGTNIGEVGPTAPGKDGEVVVTFTKAGRYSFLCGIADHASRGMKGSITVS